MQNFFIEIYNIISVGSWQEMGYYKLLVDKNVCWTEKVGLNLNKQKNRHKKKKHTCKPNTVVFNSSVMNNNGAEST